MFHTVLYRLERQQKIWLTKLLIIFLILSAVWFLFEYFSIDFPMEPLVVLVGGVATLFASYWPWKPNYIDNRLQGRHSIDYMSNNHKFIIGNNQLKFTLQFSKASNTSIYMYKDPADIESVALIHDAGKISDVKDVSCLDYSNRAVCPKEGELVALKNGYGNYAIVHIHDIRDADRGDNCNEVTLSFVINPEGKTDFS